MATDDVAQVADRHQRPADCALQATAGLNEPGQISGDARAASASSARRSSAMSVITISQRNDEKSRPERAALRLFKGWRSARRNPPDVPERLRRHRGVVNVNRERQLRSFAGSLDHAANAHAAKGLASLVDEDMGRLGTVALQTLEAGQLIPFEVVA